MVDNWILDQTATTKNQKILDIGITSNRQTARLEQLVLSSNTCLGPIAFTSKFSNAPIFQRSRVIPFIIGSTLI
jgi:hypothetical protein